MGEETAGVEAAVQGIAFDLLGRALIDLADLFRDHSPDAADVALKEVQNGVVATLRQFMADTPNHGRDDILREAAQRVRAVLLAAEGRECH